MKAEQKQNKLMQLENAFIKNKQDIHLANENIKELEKTILSL